MRGFIRGCGSLVVVLGCGSGGGETASAGGGDTSATVGSSASTGPAPTTSDGAATGQGGSDSLTTTAGSASATDTGVETSATGTTGAALPSTGEPIGTSTGPIGEASTGSTGAPGDTTDTGGDSSEAGGDSSSGGEPPCVIGDVEDTLAFTYSKSIDLGIDTIQASFYNQDEQEIVFFSYYGQGERHSIDGALLGPVMAPPEALPKLDGATFDPVNRTGLLLTQDCKVVEVDPVTISTLATIQLDTVKYGLSVCAGLAIGVDGNMYVNSYFTDEVLVVTRDGQTELGKIKLAPLGLPRPDGISLIAGSANFLVLSTTNIRSAILAPDATVLVGPEVTGQDKPPMIGGGITNPDAILTVCGDGHAWLCDEYGSKCHDYVPMDGDKDACACTIPQ